MIRTSFRELLIWQKSIDLVDIVYEITGSFPQSELFGLTSQSRRSAVSVPSNIAEGSQRTSDREFARFILIAKGSLAELFTQMFIAKRRSLLTHEQAILVFGRIEEINKMLYSFYRKLNAVR